MMSFVCAQKKDSNVKVIPPYKPVATDASDSQDKTSAAARGEKPKVAAVRVLLCTSLGWASRSLSYLFS